MDNPLDAPSLDIEKIKEETASLNSRLITNTYIKTGGDIVAAAKAGNVKVATAYKTLKKMKEYIARWFEESGLDEDSVMTQIQYVAIKSKNDMAKLKALEMIGKQLGMWGGGMFRDNLDSMPLEDLLKESAILMERLKNVKERHKVVDVEDAEVSDVRANPTSPEAVK